MAVNVFTVLGSSTCRTVGVQVLSVTQRTRRTPPVSCAERTMISSMVADQAIIFVFVLSKRFPWFVRRTYSICTRLPDTPSPTHATEAELRLVPSPVVPPRSGGAPDRSTSSPWVQRTPFADRNS